MSITVTSKMGQLHVIVRAWSSGSKAREWVEWRVDNEIEWEGPQYSTDSHVLHGTAADGDTDVKVRRVEILDPAALDDRYPDDLPSARHLLNTDD
jgi:hypothetical protein